MNFVINDVADNLPAIENVAIVDPVSGLNGDALLLDVDFADV